MTFDWYDIWAYGYGKFAKRIYNKNMAVGLPFLIPVIVADLLYPNMRKFFCEKRHFPICIAHFGIGYLNLYQTTNKRYFLENAIALVPELLSMASDKSHGLGWGMNFDWYTRGNIIPANTPSNTQTSYVYEFFSDLLAITNDDRLEGYLRRIAEHVFGDYREMSHGDSIACSYFTTDNRIVVNANSYRMLMLCDAGYRFDNPDYTKKGLATLNYVISKQNPDGSWPYSEEEPFVDNYHTCFVLRNLLKTRAVIGKNHSRLETAIDNGLKYYFAHLFDQRGLPISRSVGSQIKIPAYDSYDFAESLNLLSEFKLDRALMTGILEFVLANLLTKEGWFRFRIFPFFNAKGIPYMRYANSAMFVALTNILKLLTGSEHDGDADRSKDETCVGSLRY